MADSVVADDVAVVLPVVTAHCPSDGARDKRLISVRDEVRKAKVLGVIRLHDHKGTLTVWWANEKVARLEQARVEAVWRAHNEDLVEHRSADGRPIGASPGHSVWPAIAWPVTETDLPR